MILRILASIALAATCCLAQQPGNESPEHLFYRAFYLERAERRFDVALDLYRDFLRSAPDHEYADRARDAAVALLERAGKRAEAVELQRSARGDERGMRRLTRQIEPAERQIDSGVAPRRGDDRDRGRGRGRGMEVDFASMDDEEIAAALERIESFQDRMIERMRERGQEDRADEIETQWAAMKTALEDGDREKAQEIFDELMQSMRRRR